MEVFVEGSEESWGRFSFCKLLLNAIETRLLISFIDPVYRLQYICVPDTDHVGAKSYIISMFLMELIERGIRTASCYVDESPDIR